MAVVYKSFDYQTEARNRAVVEADANTKVALNGIVETFVTLFKTKHT
jgi:hypothetical protein